ncbi:hypothetical protein AVEN_257691-1 [Araneus ventricosus]|uniref:Uncharacterized protein n=1 Tax=Araneus ventricosus TaxID=182803 RepID=A0A4Y2LEA3_ARAVE|nr:hypothetical protein AVEN_257691-1 [Araneus ventricosus]
MPSKSDSLVKHIEDVLSSDDSDIVEAGFGSSEKEVAKAVLTLVAIASLTIPALFQVFQQTFRKPVTCVENLDALKYYEFLIAHKLDGIFGLVFSYANYIKEKWEGYVKKRHNGITLGDGIVFAAEKMPDNTVVLLDVYQVRGVPTAKWCRQNILVNYFSGLCLPEGYQVQKYCYSVIQLTNCPYPTDGYICRNIRTDKIFKVKTNHSLDVVYMDGFFWLPSKDKLGLCKRFKSLENNAFLKEGYMYEV